MYDQLYISRRIFDKYKHTEKRHREEIGDTGTMRHDGYPYVKAYHDLKQ